MGRMFALPLDAISVTNDPDQDIIEMVNGSGATAILHAIELSSSVTTDEVVRLRLCRRSTTGSGGTAATEVALDGDSTTISVAVNILVTTPGTIGSILKGWQWHQLVPFQYVPIPEDRIIIPPSGRLCLNLQTAVAATRTWSGYAVWEELS